MSKKETYVKPHRRKNSKNPGEHHVKGHTRKKANSKIKTDVVNERRRSLLPEWYDKSRKIRYSELVDMNNEFRTGIKSGYDSIDEAYEDLPSAPTESMIRDFEKSVHKVGGVLRDMWGEEGHKKIVDRSAFRDIDNSLDRAYTYYSEGRIDDAKEEWTHVMNRMNSQFPRKVKDLYVEDDLPL